MSAEKATPDAEDVSAGAQSTVALSGLEKMGVKLPSLVNVITRSWLTGCP